MSYIPNITVRKPEKVDHKYVLVSKDYILDVSKSASCDLMRLLELSNDFGNPANVATALEQLDTLIDDHGVLLRATANVNSMDERINAFDRLTNMHGTTISDKWTKATSGTAVRNFIEQVRAFATSRALK